MYEHGHVYVHGMNAEIRGHTSVWVVAFNLVCDRVLFYVVHSFMSQANWPLSFDHVFACHLTVGVQSWVWGLRLRCSCLHGKCFTYLEPSTSPDSVFESVKTECQSLLQRVVRVKLYLRGV